MQFVLILIGIAIYFFVCILLLAWVGVPLALILVPLAFIGGGVYALVRWSQVLLNRRPATKIFTPSEFSALRTSRLAKKKPGPQRPVDLAWPAYFYRQAARDLGSAGHQLAADFGRVFRYAGPRAEEAGGLLVIWPLTLPLAMAAIAGFAGVGAGFLFAAMVTAIVALLAWIAGAIAVVVLRAFTSLWQNVFRAAASCKDCYYVTRLPAYRCPGPHPGGDNLHRALRPGRLGIWYRRCSCGRKLPSMALRAAWALQGVCQQCGRPLHAGAGVATDVRIPLFGAPAAGKTHLIVGGLVSLLSLNRQGLSIKMADPESERRYQGYKTLVAVDKSPEKTPEHHPIAVTAEIRHGSFPALVHVFDAAGESLIDATVNADYGYLDLARTLVFVLDPFSVPDVRDQLTMSFKELASEVTRATHDPQDSYDATVRRLRAYGVKTETRKLAFVISKADLLCRMPISGRLRPSCDSATVRQWLAERGLDNLLALVDRDFEKAEFFFVSGKDTGQAGALAPFAWLLRQERLTLLE